MTLSQDEIEGNVAQTQKIINHELALTEDPQQLSELENYEEFGLSVFS